jgi:hypothetical protein
MFGEKTFDEDSIKRYTKKQFYLPSRIEDWLVQLCATARFIDLLTCVAFLIPLARHFLTRLRALINHNRPQQQQITVSKHIGLDCELWERFLWKAFQGISMNRITVRQPTRLAVSDSCCPFGIGAFLLEGRAWRVRIPESSPIYGQSTANNFLEFLGMFVNMWLMCLTFTDRSESLLAVGDNTSAIGWLFRSSHISPDSLYYDSLQLGARKLALLVTGSEHCLASQHIKGETNLVADLLSWSGDIRGAPHPLAMDNPSDDELTLRFHSHLPQLQDLSSAQRSFVLDNASIANRQIVLDSKQEAGHETEDRVWRRWKSYCTIAGATNNCFLIALSDDASKELLFRSFLPLSHS